MSHRRFRLLPALAGALGLLALLGAASPAAAQCNATQLCAPGANPCTITAGCTVPAGATFDIRPRALVIQQGKTLTVDNGSEPLTIKADSILFEPGAKIVAKGITMGVGQGGAVRLEATKTLTLQTTGAGTARIDVNGSFTGGVVEMVAGGDIDINATIVANTGSQDGFGGQIDVVSNGGAVTVRSLLQAMGGGRGENGSSGGTLSIFAQNDIVVTSAGRLDVSNGDCICDVTLDSANGNVDIQSNSEMNLKAAGAIGDGGSVSVSAGKNVNLAGKIFATARGSGGDTGYGGGFGGELDVFAGGNVTMSGTTQLDGASPDGDGGSADVQAIGAVTVSGVLQAPVTGQGSGGDVFIAAGTDLTVSNKIDVKADASGGTASMSAGGLATISGTVTAKSATTGFAGGAITLTACTINVTSTGLLEATGPGAFPAATNLLQASNTMTISGKILAGALNRLEWKVAPPTFVGAASNRVPTPVVAQAPELECCVNCPVVTTTTTVPTTTTTTTTSLATTTTSTTSTTLPPVTTTTLPATTTTTIVTTTTTSTSTTSTTAPPVCGNGIVEAGEQCDGGACCNACSFRPNTFPCRPAAGDCDLAETCTGSSATCPADVKSTATCRPAAGDCDVAESCNGTSNTCPADQFKPVETPCRAAAGVCDVAEACTGTSATCPADAKSTAPCRPAAGDCDVAEVCNGVSNTCPADQFKPASTPCRAAAGVCDLAETCTGSSATCPADAKSTAPCREAAGECDVAETCDGVGNACPADAFAENGTLCGAGGDLCTSGGTCESGVCAGAGQPVVCPACESCDPGTGDCVAAPRLLCATPIEAGKAQLSIKDKPDPAKDQLQWKWLKGAATPLASFGNPVASTSYALCVFDQSGGTPSVVFRGDVPAGGTCGTKPCWAATGTKGFKFASKTGNADGVIGLTLTAGVAGKAKIQFKAKGANLSSIMPAPPLPLPLLVQLQADNGTCFEAAYSAAGLAKNVPGEFKGNSK
ncbi:MAG: hypothetical protein KIT14_12720 [bacterium]|nr:hypothetical protein [bacterium]